MGSFEGFEVGQTFESRNQIVEQRVAAKLIELGGYTHPMFNDSNFAAKTPLGHIPVPGEAVLLLMGGLMEQTGRFDETTLALAGFDDVQFKSPAFAGDTIKVTAEVLSKEVSSSGSTGIVDFSWTCVNGQNEVLVTSKARMLFRLR